MNSVCRNILLALCATLAAWNAGAAEGDQVYRYTDANGVVHYTDKPPAKDAKPINLPKIQTFRSGQPPKNLSVSGGGDEVTKFSLAFDSPTPEQTYREPGATVNVSVSVMPGLVGGYGLMYTVDGQPLNDAPSFTTSISVPGLERGSHTIAVSLVDAKRRPQANASVTVHMKPPTAKQQ